MARGERVQTEPDLENSALDAAPERPAPPKESGPRVYLIEASIFVVWLFLMLVNLLLSALHALYRMVDACRVPPTTRPKEVVIVGASFGGLAAQRQLSGRRDVSVKLIDFKTYFEYTPGVLRCFVNPAYLKELTCRLPQRRNKLVLGAMTGATADAVTVRDSYGGERQVPFDYLVLAIGSTYAEPVKPTAAEPTLAERKRSWRAAADKLAAARSVIIVGAGPVGVELAGEILTEYPGKKLTFVDMATAILPGFDEPAAVYARAWLERRGAQLLGGEPIETIGTESVLLKSGVRLEADVVYRCVGVAPNTEALKASPFAEKFGFRNSIEVNDHLQVDGHPRVFCVGDMMSHPSRELKLGHTAEVNAHLAAANILRAVHRRPLLHYPNGVTGADTTPKLWALSLGRYAACLGFNGWVCTGWWVAVAKWILEWTKVAAAAEKPVGILFWKVSDDLSFWLGRTLFKVLPKGEEEPRWDPYEQQHAFPHPRLEFLRNRLCGELGMWLMRAITASLIFHHGLAKFSDVNAFATNVVAPYFPFLPCPVFWTVLAACIEVGGSVCLAIGLWVRPAALLLAGTMLNAVYFQVASKGWQNFPFDPDAGGSYTFEPSMAFLGITLCIALMGPGRLVWPPRWTPFKLDATLEHLKHLEWPWAHIGVLAVRVTTALLIVHHGQDKLADAETFATKTVAAYFSFLPGSPYFWTYLSAAFEIGGACCFLSGFLVRPAAALVGGTMLNALYFHMAAKGGQSFPFCPNAACGAYSFEPSFAYLGVAAFLALHGPGKFALKPNGF